MADQLELPVIDAEFSVQELRGLEMQVRQASDTLFSRAQFASMAGLTFNGRRDLYKALGYRRILLPKDYRERYKRLDVAARLVEAFPNATWRSGGKLTEDSDNKDDTTFEKEWEALNTRLDIWPTFENADICLGWSRFSIIVLIGPGELNTPLLKLKPEDLHFLAVYGEEDVVITEYEIDTKSPRFGLPLTYLLRRQFQQTTTVQPPLTGNGLLIHHSRVIHVAENTIDNRVFGQVRLERGWNTLDDIEKVRGGGAEAYWKRADAGMHVKLDPSLPMGKTPTEAKENLDKLKQKLHDYNDKLDRTLTTRGVDIETLTSNVSDFKSPLEALMSMLSVGYGIPKRILDGSERGELASTQDRANFEERVMDRRRKFAGPKVVRLFVNTLIALGTISKPSKDYLVEWPAVFDKTPSEQTEIATGWSKVETLSLNEQRKASGFDPYTGNPETDALADVPLALQAKATLRLQAPAPPNAEEVV